jgi:hypothetical protein
MFGPRKEALSTPNIQPSTRNSQPARSELKLWELGVERCRFPSAECLPHDRT